MKRVAQEMHPPIAPLESTLKWKAPDLKFRKRTYAWSSRTLLMAVLNVTPDSFSDGGKFFETQRAVERGLELWQAGADILDIGGESTRPGSRPLEEEEELRRVIPVIQRLSPQIDIPISIDTRKARVAERALGEGAEIINDISALRFDPKMVEVVAQSNAYVVLMHMQGEPETMQLEPQYRDLLREIKEFFQERIIFALSQGVARERILLDPGLGFGKSLEKGHNLQLLKNLADFKEFGQPLLVGPSRKAFIGKILDLPPSEREEGTMAAAAVAIMNGANIIRVHEVKRMHRLVRVVDAILHAPPAGILPENH
jgi:dihydropteroate synthase